MTRTQAETANCLVRAERVQQLSRFTLIFLLARVGRGARDALQQRLDGIDGVLQTLHRSRRRSFRALPLTVVVFFDDVREDELVSMARYRAHEARLARIVSEHASDRPYGLAQSAIRDDDVGPDAIEDVAAMHRLATPFDEENEQIEITRDERLLAPAAEEHAAPRRQNEVSEPIAGQFSSA